MITIPGLPEASDIDLTLGGDRLSHNDLLQQMARIDDLLLPWQVSVQPMAEAIHTSPHPWLIATGMWEWLSRPGGVRN